VKAIEPFPVRRLAAVFAAAGCSYLALASHHHHIIQERVVGVGFGAPPPPTETFAEAFLAVPGILSGLPIIIVGSTTQKGWITSTGVVLGTAFFWYCVGWYIDSVRATLNAPQPPRYVVGYMRALVILSTIIFPLGVLAGFGIGNHSCASGAPPAWSEPVMYGIVMSWVSVGTFFAWLRFRRRWEQKHPPVRLQI